MREIKLQPDIYSYNLLACVIKDCAAGDPSHTSSLLEEEDEDHKLGIKQSDMKKQLSNPNLLEVKVASPVPESHSTDTEEEAVVISIENTSVERLESSAGGFRLPDILGKKLKAGSIVALGALDKPQDRYVSVCVCANHFDYQ